MASCTICQRWCRMGASSMSALRCHLKGKCFLYWEEGRDKEPGQAAACAKWKEELIPFLRPDPNIWVPSLGVSHVQMFFFFFRSVCMSVFFFFFFLALTDPKRFWEIKTPLMLNRWLVQVTEHDGGCESRACGGPTSARLAFKGQSLAGPRHVPSSRWPPWLLSHLTHPPHQGARLHLCETVCRRTRRDHN